MVSYTAYSGEWDHLSSEQLTLLVLVMMSCAIFIIYECTLPPRGPRPRRAVEVPGCGEVAVTAVASGCSTYVTLDWSRIFGKLPFTIPFCSATLCEDGTVYVSGTIGLRAPATAESAPAIVEGGPKAECVRTMELIEAVLRACGGGVQHITMAHVYLTDNTKERFAMMNAGYLEFMGERPLPARITVGCGALALGASVEIDVVARIR